MNLYIVASILSIPLEIKWNQIEYVDKSSTLVGYDCITLPKSKHIHMMKYLTVMKKQIAMA